MNSRILFATAGIIIVVTGAALATRSFEPIIGLPGGALSGTIGQRPDSWVTADKVSTIQLETRLDNPYSVNLWGVGTEKSFYVATDKQGTAWSRHLDQDANVKLRIGALIYPLKAAIVRDDVERQQVLSAYVEKYDVEPAEIADNAGLIYRLNAR